MGLIARDRELIKRCLHHEPGAWNDFVDRFLGLVYHVVQHTADMRSYTLRPEDKEDVAAQVLVKVVENDYAALRQFRGKSSLASYLTVIARRTCVNELAGRMNAKDKEQLFDPFFTSKTVWMSLGLGLSVAQRIVTDHGGKFEVTSEPGKGSEFRVYLPATL